MKLTLKWGKETKKLDKMSSVYYMVIHSAAYLSAIIWLHCHHSTAFWTPEMLQCLINCCEGWQIAGIRLLRFIRKSNLLAKWQPNYSMFSMNTKGEVKSQKQPTVDWPKLKVNIGKEHRVIKDFWQANEPADRENQRYICGERSWYLFTVSRLDWTACLLCNSVGRLGCNHHHCCGKHAAAAHETHFQKDEFTFVHSFWESRSRKSQIVAAAFI